MTRLKRLKTFEDGVQAAKADRSAGFTLREMSVALDELNSLVPKAVLKGYESALKKLRHTRGLRWEITDHGREILKERGIR